MTPIKKTPMKKQVSIPRLSKQQTKKMNILAKEIEEEIEEEEIEEEEVSLAQEMPLSPVPAKMTHEERFALVNIPNNRKLQEDIMQALFATVCRVSKNYTDANFLHGVWGHIWQSIQNQDFLTPEEEIFWINDNNPCWTWMGTVAQLRLRYAMCRAFEDEATIVLSNFGMNMETRFSSSLKWPVVYK